MRLNIRLVFIIAIISLDVYSSRAMELRFRNIAMNEGLSFNSIMCIFQDHDGIVWIGTRDGLNKYDGVDNTVYRHQLLDSFSISDNHINSIFEDSNNNLWVGTSNGLNKLDRLNDSFERIYADNTPMSLSHRYIKCITEGSSGNIIVGTSEGFNIIREGVDTIQRMTIKNIASNANNIIDLYFDRSNNLWICTKGGLFRSKDLVTFERVVLNATIEEGRDLFEFRDLLQQDDGTYWAATENHGLFSFLFENDKPANVINYNTQNSEILSNQIRRLKLIKSELWMATLDGMYALSLNNRKIMAIQGEGLSQSSFHDILVDNEEGIWLASYTDGVNYYHRQNDLFPHIKKSHVPNEGVNDNSITGFLDDGINGLWISTGGGGLNFFNKKTKQFTYFTEQNSAISNNNIKSMAFDQDKNIWIGTYDGLNFYDKKRNRFKSFHHQQNHPNTIIKNQVHAVHVDQDGLVWIGTNGGGVQVFDPKTGIFSAVPTQFLNINTLFQDDKNQIWVGSNEGLECVNQVTKSLVPLAIHSPSGKKSLFFVNNITNDSLGRILIGTQNHGICVIDGKNIQWLNGSNGFVNNTINAIIETSPLTYWISTNNGLMKVEMQRNNDLGNELNYIEFNMSHGLQNMQFYPGCAIKDKTGRLYFGGVNGYNTFDPFDITKREYHPPIAISEFNVFSDEQQVKSIEYPKERITSDSTISLTYDQRNISIAFGGINFVNPKHLFYRYSLEKDVSFWSDLGHQRVINLTYLPIGKHTLKLQATSDPRSWGDNYTTIEFRILPPFWRTWWAYLIYVIILGMLLFLYFFYSIQWAHLKSNLQMEQFQKEKEKELHESKLRFFTDVSHELRTPLTLILAPIENILKQQDVKGRFRNQLQLIHKNGDRMFLLINQLLDLRKLETGNTRLQVAEGNLIKFIKEICLAFDAVSDMNDVRLKLTIDNSKNRLWFDRDKMEIVFYNILSNAYKYTPKGGSIHLSIDQITKTELPDPLQKKGSEGGYRIVITDSGQGISKEDIENIFQRYYFKKDNANKNPTGIGLELAKRMIEIHHGLITVDSKLESKEEKGSTSFIIYLLKGNKHFKQEEIIEDFKSSEDISQYSRDFLQREIEFNLPNPTDGENQIFNKKKSTILVVEDNLDVRKFIIELLQEEYNVLEAENGKKGLESALKTGPDMIICDIMMPEMTGIEMCREVKKDSRISHIPVILLTARTAITFKFEGFETGADEYITKPFSASYLLLRVKNLLNQREVLRNHFKTEKILEPTDLSITSTDEKLLKKAINYINDNISKTNITVNELSYELGLSRVHFYRKMKALTNMTAIEFIRSVRLKQACRLLEQGKFNIKEVKNLVGFDNADYFRKCFKEAYNLTPSEYAEQYKGSNL
ncbi:MAG: two-component regulator propeller domain-containing protein [Cyclobacteriaceae bacterium]